MESDRAVRTALARYDEPLLRAVAARLFKPRNQWPVDELIDRAAQTLANTPVIDRRLKDLPPSARSLLATIGLSGRSDWPVGQLLALLATLGYAEGLAPILTLLDGGLALPVLPDSIPLLRDWESWLGAEPTRARLIVPRVVAERAIREGTGLPQLPSKSFEAKVVHSADGLEWLLRMGVLWQQLRADPVRLTQANALFKRDQTRLQEDPLLAAPVGEQLVTVPDVGALVMGMGIASGLFVAEGGLLKAGPFSTSWEEGLPTTLREMWRAIPDVQHWDPLRGYYLSDAGEPFPTVALPALLLLAAQPDGAWTHPSDVAEYLVPRHPSWAGSLEHADEAETWIEAMFLGWALPLKLVELTQDGEGWWVRLSGIGRYLLAGGAAPDATNPFPRCLVVQPNGDVIAYRQGLTPGLIAKLSRFANWKMLGPACTLGLTADSVYRGLESGIHLSEMISVLQQNSGHPVPANVLDLIRRWAGKRERIAVYSSATILEFNTAAELEEAVTRGLVSRKLTERMGLAEGEVDYKHFRLLGNRDYEARPRKCVTFRPDGVTFTVDISAADLLLEAELSRLAEPVSDAGAERTYRITPSTARQLREQGMPLADFEQWFLERSGEPISASARLLFVGGGIGEMRRRLVLSLPSEAVTDGICQWPETADLLEDRLGPYSVAVPEENVEELVRRLAEVGVEARREM